MRRTLIFLGGLSAVLLPTVGELSAIDSNADGMSDVWQQKYSISTNQANQDCNGTGLTNIQKSLLGFDPCALNLVFRVDEIPDAANNELHLRINTVLGKKYQIESSSNLMNWSSLGPVVTGNGSQIDVVTTMPSSTPAFFRARLVGDVDADNDGLTAWEENELGTNDSKADTDGDGISDAQEFQNGTDPLDYFNGVTPSLSIVGGNDQVGDPNTFLVQPIVVQVSGATGQPLANAPVTFSTNDGQLSLTNANTESLASVISLRTGPDGTVAVYFLSPDLANYNSAITITAGPSNNPAAITANETTTDLPAPNAPSEITAIKNSDGTTTISWQDNSNNEEQFVVERQEPDGTWVEVGSIGPDAVSLTISN